MQVQVSQANICHSLNQDKILDSSCPRNLHLSTSTSTLSLEHFCRICRETEKRGELYSHCECKGSVGLAHSSCLLVWIKKSGCVKCELCKEKYITISSLNKMFWQWKLPRIGTKGWLKLAFFIGFLSMLITFTAWIIWSRVSSSSQAKKERNKRQVEYTYLVYAMLVLIAVVGMYALNFRPFFGYISRCIVINQDIILIPKGELCQDTSGEKCAEKIEKCGNEKFCKHSKNRKDTYVQVRSDNICKGYAKLHVADITMV